jgi:hypothetical protein
MSSVTMTLSTAGNPDFGQYAPLSPSVKIVIGKTDLEEAMRLMIQYARDYRNEWELGGGNWTNPIVYVNKVPYAYISYNMRAWATVGNGNSWEVDSVEIKVDDWRYDLLKEKEQSIA